MMDDLSGKRFGYAPMDDLSRIAMHYGTDKAPGIVPNKFHFYTQRYNDYLACMRTTARTILEIGVLDGASLFMWRDYFPNAEVIGVDIDPRRDIVGESRVRVIVADARDSAVRLRLVTMGPFDLVVDDASHEFALMRDLAVALLPHARVYIIEDVAMRDRQELAAALQPVAGAPEVLISRIPDHAAFIYAKA